MTKENAFIQLKDKATKLATTSYEEILQLFQMIGNIPIPLARLAPGTDIERARPNDRNNLFTRVSELSYITDKAIIENRMTEYGRANKPHQPVFYGSIQSSQIYHPRVTAIAEVSALFQDPTAVNIEGELYTVSRWLNSGELLLAEMVFSQAALEANEDTKRNFEHQIQYLREVAPPQEIPFYLDFITFISEQFSRPKSTHHDYMISTAYADFIMRQPGIHGVTFPSVQTQYYGQNIVLPPTVVDQFVTIDLVITQRLHRHKMEMLLNNHKYCNNPKDCVDNFICQDHDPKDIITEEGILAELKASTKQKLI